MTLASFLVLLIIAGVCGALGAGLGGYSHAGCLGSILLGFIGAVLGRWLAVEFRLPPILVLRVGGFPFPVFWAVVGAALFVFVLGLLRLGGGRRAN